MPPSSSQSIPSRLCLDSATPSEAVRQQQRKRRECHEISQTKSDSDSQRCHHQGLSSASSSLKKKRKLCRSKDALQLTDSDSMQIMRLQPTLLSKSRNSTYNSSLIKRRNNDINSIMKKQAATTLTKCSKQKIAQKDQLRNNGSSNNDSNTDDSADKNEQDADDSSDLLFEPRQPQPLKNVVHQLLHRSILGRRRVAVVARNCFVRPPMPTWKRVSSVELQHHPSSVSAAASSGRQYGDMVTTMTTSRIQVRHMVWDDKGILLATASSDDKVCIFDWDGVVAAQMQAASFANNNNDNSDRHNVDTYDAGSSKEPPPPRRMMQHHFVPPIVQFQAPHAITTLQWNPWDPDMLAVGFRSHSHVHLYDVAKVADSVSARPQHHSNNSNNNNATLLRACYISVGESQHRTKNLSRMIFVDPTHVVLAHDDGQLTCWNIQRGGRGKRRGSVQQRLVWRYSVKYSVTCLTNVSADCLVVAGHDGTLMLVNWKCSVRAAFSSEPSPRVLRVWNIARAVAAAYPQLVMVNKSSVWLGVQRVVALDYHPNTDATTTDSKRKLRHSNEMKMENDVSKNNYQNVPLWAACRLLLVTSGGWVMETTLTELKDCQSFCTTIHHRPPLTQYVKWDGAAVASQSSTRKQEQQNNFPANSSNNDNNSVQSSLSYSTPHMPLQSAITTCKTLLAWSKVPAVTWTLPHHDRLVVTGSITALRCQQSQQDQAVCVGWIETSTLSRQQQQQQQPMWRIQEIACQTTPHALAIHPSGEWMAVATMSDYGIVLFQAHGKK